jgi:hypothetical protein
MRITISFLTSLQPNRDPKLIIELAIYVIFGAPIFLELSLKNGRTLPITHPDMAMEYGP